MSNQDPRITAFIEYHGISLRQFHSAEWQDRYAGGYMGCYEKASDSFGGQEVWRRLAQSIVSEHIDEGSLLENYIDYNKLANDLQMDYYITSGGHIYRR